MKPILQPKPRWAARLAIACISMLLLVSLQANAQCITTNYAPVSATGSVSSGVPNNLLLNDGVVGTLTSAAQVRLDFGSTIPSGAVITILASAFNTGDPRYNEPGNFNVQISLDNITYVNLGDIEIPVSMFTLTPYIIPASTNFRYVRVAAISGNRTSVDYVSISNCAICSVSGVVDATQATCGASGANANAKLTLISSTGGATKVGYSTGSSYTGPDFLTATALSAAPMTLTSTLANPKVGQPYTVRLFKDATCYKDYVVTIDPQVCETADLSVTVSPANQTGNKGERLTYVVTLTNAGPNIATNVLVNIPMPDPTATLLSASPALGSYSTVTKAWSIPSLPVGNTTLTFTVQVN